MSSNEFAGLSSKNPAAEGRVSAIWNCSSDELIVVYVSMLLSEVI
jgi:hypothetical protein